MSNTTTAMNPSIGLSMSDLEQLNREFIKLSVDDRIIEFYKLFRPEDAMMTTSFGTKSIYLLHHIYRLKPEQGIYFLDTKYHFRHTYDYKEMVRKAYDLRLTYIYPDKLQNALTTDEKWWQDHPRMCCTVNKIAPLEPYIRQHKFWISGLMSYQTEHRARLNIFEIQGDIIKFHPIIDVEEEDIQAYINKYDLPKHPLEDYGYGSVGCTHCTRKGKGREGRWEGTPQKECGLHLNYFFKNKH